MKNLLALIIFGTSMAVALPQAVAKQESAAVAKKAPKKAAAKRAKPVKSAKAAAAGGAALATAAAGAASKVSEADLAGAVGTDYACELGNKLTIYTKQDDDQAISLRWKNDLHRLTRIGTSSGAQRFENEQQGLVWLGIPSKGMLLNSKKGQQLANECKNSQQVAQESNRSLSDAAVAARY